MARSTTLEDSNILAKTLPAPPSLTISLNADTGDDDNDGFTAPVASGAGVSKVLSRYNWNNNVTISLTGTSTQSLSLVLNGAGIYNLGKLTFSGGTRTGVTQFINFNSVEVNFTTFDGDLGILFFQNCDSVNIKGFTTFQNKTGGASSITIVESAVADIGGITIDTSVNFSGTVIDLFDVARVVYDPGASSGFTVGNLIRFSSGCFYASLENGGGAITGKVIDAFAAENISINFSGWGFTGTIADTYPSNYIIDGQSYKQLSTYVDDTAAGVGGLTSGALYQTATGELRIKL